MFPPSFFYSALCESCGKIELKLSHMHCFSFSHYHHGDTCFIPNTVCTQARQQAQPKLAPVPKKAPTTKSWHAVRDGVARRVAEILGGGEGPAVAALTGRSGAGKTTAAAALVGERGPIRPRTGETEDAARIRLDRVRALFPDGVVWLRVGRGGGVADRLPSLMRELATQLWEDVMHKRVDPPAVGENSESYVEKIVSRESLRCLVVADDVWEAEVVTKLRKTGMWVLLTTRQPSMVEDKEKVAVDKLTQEEAEEVLRGAAGMSRGEHLCDGAMDVLKICDFVAMDIAFVGRWSSVRAANGIPKSSRAWARAVRDIEAQIEDVRGQAQTSNACGMDDPDVNRRAVLRAGFKYLGAEDALAQELYVLLAVLPHGHNFGDSDFGVLLDHDEEVITVTTLVLEQWAVIRADPSNRYRMHDAHVDFARIELEGSKKLRELAIERWTSHISRLDVALGFDLYTLLDMWRVLARVGGQGWWACRAYSDQLVDLDVSDPSKHHAVGFVAKLFGYDQKFGELEGIMRRVLKSCDEHEGASHEVQMAALYYTWQSLFIRGHFQESDDVRRRLVELVGVSFQLKEPDCDTGLAQTSTTLHMYGVYAEAAGRRKDAEEWFRKALKVEKNGGRTTSSQTVVTLHELGRCLRLAGRLEEAERLLKRALDIMTEAKLGSDHLFFAFTLQNLSKCVRIAGRLGEAEELLKQALEIKEAKLGADHVGTAWTVHEMGVCARMAGRLGEAEEFCKRALKIREAKLGVEDTKVARTLDELGLCVQEAGRLREAEELFRRVLKIREVKLGADDPKVAKALYRLGLCMREAEQLGDAEALFRRALEIQTVKFGAYDPRVAKTLLELGVCVRKTGRLGEAEELLKRAIEIEETGGVDGGRSASFCDTA